jgi:F-type H+-transporting ATPase subunit gamma
VQQAHAVLDSVRQYTVMIQESLGEAVRNLGAEPWPASEGAGAGGGFVVVFGSEHGFVGAFNERVLERARIERAAADELLVVGARCQLAAEERREQVSWSTAMATQVGGIDEVALRIAERLGQASSRAALQRVILAYTRSAGGATWRIVTETLLPFDIKPYLPRRFDRPPPVSHLSPKTLVDGLIAELLFAELAHAATESFASENAARLAAMEAAADNVDGKLEDLRRLERELRQEEITTELLDVVTGAEAITTAGREGAHGD